MNAMEQLVDTVEQIGTAFDEFQAQHQSQLNVIVRKLNLARVTSGLREHAEPLLIEHPRETLAPRLVESKSGKPLHAFTNRQAMLPTLHPDAPRDLPSVGRVRLGLVLRPARAVRNCRRDARITQ